MNGKAVVRLLAALALIVASGASFGQAALIRHHEVADKVLVVKSERKLYLLKDGEVLREFAVSLGLRPVGHKEREGDFRTPEGRYVLESRNPSSDYFLSIKVSYPNAEDRARAR